MAPLVSVIIASYNKEKYLAETLDSVLRQTFPDFEVLVIDDASTDRTVEVAAGYAKKDPRIKVSVNDNNRGANYSRNEGIRKAQGAFIIFLDADDLLAEHCLETRMAWASEAPGVNLFVSTMDVFYKTPGDAKGLWLPHSKDPLRDFLRHDLPWSILQPTWKRTFLASLGGFDESFQRLQDVELNTRALFSKDIHYALRPGEADCYYRIDEARKNFKTFEFLGRWIDSALKYYAKFYQPAKERNYHRYLAGTIYRTYLQLIYHYRQKEIDQSQFKILEAKLLRSPGLHLGYRSILFSFSRVFNTLPFRIPGINLLLGRLMVW